MRPSHLSYCFLGSFLIAVFCLQWWQAPAYPLPLFLVLGLLGIFGILGRVARRRHALGGIACITGIAVALTAVARITHIPSPVTVDFYAGKSEIAIRGTIADDADRRPLKTNYTVEANMIRTGTRTIPVSGKILMTVKAGNRPLEYGDEIVARGKLELPGETNDGFRYDNYLSRSSIYSLIKDPLIERTGRNNGNSALLLLFRLRGRVEDRINLLLPEPHASLLAGLLIGSRRGIPDDLQTAFKATGLTHLVAISGYNITMLITVMSTLLFWLPLRWRFAPSVLIIIGFTLLTGASASAVRAAVMGILSLLAIQLGRVQTARLTVLWTAFLMIAWNPKVLWYDTGFALSYLALIGVMEIPHLISPYLQWLPEFGNIRESLCLTLSAQMLASAWIFYLFGELSLIAPLGNLLAPPLVPIATLLGLLGILLSGLWMPLGQLVSALTWLPLQWIISVTQVLGSLPFAAVTMEGMSTVWIIVYYSILTIWVVWRNVTTHTAISSSSPTTPSA